MAQHPLKRARIALLLTVLAWSPPASARGDGVASTATEAATQTIPDLFAELVALGPAVPGRPARAPGGARESVSAALAGQPLDALRAFLRAEVAADGGALERAVALELLARVGNAADLPLALDLARTPAGATEAPPQTALEQTVVELLRRDARALEQLGGLLRFAPESLRPPLVRAAGSVPSAASLQLLTELLDDAQLRVLALTQAGRVLAAGVRPPDERLVVRIERLLSGGGTVEQREAAVVLGKLGDFESVPDLIGLLEHGDRGVRENALWSLRQITGLKVGGNPKRWRGWYDAELGWWRAEAQRVFRLLHSGDQAQMVAAINEIAGRRYLRHDLARELTAALDSPSPEVLRMTCAALACLGSPTAVPELRARRDHPNAEVRRAVDRALAALTGEQPLTGPGGRPADPLADLDGPPPGE